MCGIAGIVSKDKPVDLSRLQTMVARIKHRGPNDEGYYLQDNIGLAFVRLSIIDLSNAGHQPIIDSTGRYSLIFNGEIYNYIELRQELEDSGVHFIGHSDSEVLLQCYIRYGKECLNKLNGMFSFVVYDKQEKSLFGARDRFGVKPFYYFKSESEFIFASEIPSILAVYNQINKANKSAIYDYLVFNRTDQTEDTFFEGIKKLQHGHCFYYKDGFLSIEQWYNLKERVGDTVEREDVDKYRSILEDSIRLRLRSDVPVGVCLSGGLDSSSIVSVISKRLNNPNIHTYSAVFQKGNAADESSYIDCYQNTLHNMHYTTPTWESLRDDLDSFVQLHAEPVPSTSPYAQYCVMRRAKKEVTVTLDGQGADEELAGYPYFWGFYFKELLRNRQILTLAREAFAYVGRNKSLYGIKSMLYFLLPSNGRSSYRANDRGYLTKRFATEHRHNVISENLYGSKSLRESLINHFEYKLEHLLKWDDRNSMAFSVESRTPFLDYRLVEYSLKLENKAKLFEGYTKSILRNSMSGILPDKIRTRVDKKGFVTPEDEWFRTPWFQTYIKELLTSESMNQRGIIDCEKALKMYDKHLKGDISISKDIWKWVHLELWFRKFIDNNGQ